MFLPVFGRKSDVQISLGIEIFRIGISSNHFQMTIYPPEQVPKMASYPLTPAIALILDEWQVYISSISHVIASNR